MKTILLAALAMAVVGAQATVLTFDIDGATAGMTMPQTYGDNVTAANMGIFHYDISNGITPDVTVDYVGLGSSQTDLNFWTTGYSDLVNVVEFEPDGASGYNLVFTGSNGNGVRLESFDLGNWSGAVTLAALRVRNELGAVLWSQTNIAVPAFNAPHLSFAPDVAGQVLTLEVDLSGLGSNSDNIGLDNIAFTQEAVPEPLTLIGLCAAGAWITRRRKSA